MRPTDERGRPIWASPGGGGGGGGGGVGGGCRRVIEATRVEATRSARGGRAGMRPAGFTRRPVSI